LHTGAVKDDSATLRSVGITQGAKVMLIGSTITDVMKVNMTPDQAATTVAEGIFQLPPQTTNPAGSLAKSALPATLLVQTSPPPPSL
jgi:predicted RecA/RadA family phage recombinase